MEVEKYVTQDWCIDWKFKGDINEDEAWKIVEEDTQAMKESGYEFTYGDSLYTLNGGIEVFHVSQIWSKDVDDA